MPSYVYVVLESYMHSPLECVFRKREAADKAVDYLEKRRTKNSRPYRVQKMQVLSESDIPKEEPQR